MLSWRPRRILDPFVVHVASPAAAVLAITCSLMLVAAFWAAHRSDVLAIERQRAVVTRAVAVERSELGREQASVAIWDDAVLRLRAPKAADLQWASDNIGVWLKTTYDHDAVTSSPTRARRSTPCGTALASGLRSMPRRDRICLNWWLGCAAPAPTRFRI